MKDILMTLGFEIKTLVASFLGSVAAAFMMPNLDRRIVATVIFVGVVAGNYAGPWVAHLLGAESFSAGVAVLIGFLAMPLGKRLTDWAANGKLPWIGHKSDASNPRD